MSSKIKYKTSFQDDLLANDEFSTWLQKIKGNVHCAKCWVCWKTVLVSGQGVKAMELHAKSAKHRENHPKPGGSAIHFQV